MRRLRLGFDVDVCIIRSDLHHMVWLCDKIGTTLNEFMTANPDFRPPFSYNLSKHFEKDLKLLGIDGMDYWRQRDLYDNMLPDPAAKSVIEYLHNQGHEIIFVTKLKGDHHKSKCYMLNREFPYRKGIICTHEKGAMEGAIDVMVDDRLDNLAQFGENSSTNLILSPSPYTQSEYTRTGEVINREKLVDLDVGDRVFGRGWEEIACHISKLAHQSLMKTWWKTCQRHYRKKLITR